MNEKNKKALEILNNYHSGLDKLAKILPEWVCRHTFKGPSAEEVSSYMEPMSEEESKVFKTMLERAKFRNGK